MTLVARVVSRYHTRDLSSRVAARYLEAYEFSSPEERKKYLKDHPGADPSRHTVKEEKKSEAGPEEKPSFLGKLKGVTDKAKAALKKLPREAQKFFSDEGHRRQAIQDLHKSVEEAPAKYAKKLVDTAKHEIHEFKEAGGAVRDVLKGKKLSDSQKKAVKTVAIHMGITLTAAALTSTGLFAGVAFTGKALIKHIALKAAARSLGHLHTFQELGHVGHGVATILSKFAAEEEDPEKVLAALVMKSVQEELENLDEESLTELLNTLGEAATKEAAEAKSASDLLPLLDEAEGVLKRFRVWVRGFPRVLQQAQQEAVNLEGTGLVWQDRLVQFWREADALFEVLAGIDDQIEEVYLHSPKMGLSFLATQARSGTAEKSIPRKARLEHGFGNPQFRDHPKQKGHIAYEITRLEEWAKAFEGWVEDSFQTFREVRRKARRLV